MPAATSTPASSTTVRQRASASGRRPAAPPPSITPVSAGDGSGLIYMNARYYDPAIGQFTPPDTLVPDATSVLDYNRFMYVRGRALNANDPSGHNTAMIASVEIALHLMCMPYRVPSPAEIREAEMPQGSIAKSQ
ncbi:MAG: RHS repeat-associated core domain-containing protein [Caldilineaceae bacterium]